MKQRNTSRLLCLCALAVVTFTLVNIDVVGLAQNTNSSTTTDDSSMQNTNANMGRSGRRRRGRRGSRAANANTGDMTANDNMAGSNDNSTMAAEPSMPATGDSSGTMAMSSGVLGRVGEATTLDGTYTGTINYPGAGLTGDATLTISGNTFTLESGGNTQTGTLTTQSWPGYTAVSMRFGTETPAKIVSLRARHRGTGLWLNSVGGEANAFSFSTSGGGSMGGRRRGRRRAATPPAPPAETMTPPPGV